MPTTPNMNLTLPTVSQTPGPTWANQINADLSVLDAHNHVPGSGVPITSAALNINADVNFATHSAIGLNSTQYINQNAPLSVCSVYSYNGELYYNDATGTQIPITSNGSVVGPVGQWTNLAPPGEAGFSVGSGTFYFTSNTTTSTFGALQAGALKLQTTGFSSPVILTISPVTASYTLTLPVASPTQVGSLLSSNNLGSMSWVISDSTISITSSTIGVAPLGITSAQLADSSVNTPKIVDQAVTQAKMEQKSTSNSGIINFTISQGTFTVVPNSTITMNVLAGRPVWVWLQTEPNGLPGNINTVNDNADIIGGVFNVSAGSTQDLAHTRLGVNVGVSPSTIAFAFVPSQAGQYQIFLKGRTINSFGDLIFTNMRLRAFQL